jgi:tubulin--tyrosine ligase-like protein 12
MNYSLGIVEGTTPVWFINDEVGSVVAHSDAPNVKMMTFLYSPNNQAADLNLIPYTIMWPV